MSKENWQRLRQDGIQRVWERYGGDTAYIAKLYGVSQSFVYKSLRIHCINTKQDYQSFLRFPHKPHILKIKGVKRKVKLGTFGKKMKFRPSRNFLEAVKIDSDIDFILEILKTSRADDVDDIIECAQMILTTIDILTNN